MRRDMSKFFWILVLAVFAAITFNPAVAEAQASTASTFKYERKGPSYMQKRTPDGGVLPIDPNAGVDEPPAPPPASGWWDQMWEGVGDFFGGVGDWFSDTGEEVSDWWDAATKDKIWTVFLIFCMLSFWVIALKGEKVEGWAAVGIGVALAIIVVFKFPWMRLGGWKALGLIVAAAGCYIIPGVITLNGQDRFTRFWLFLGSAVLTALFLGFCAILVA